MEKKIVPISVNRSKAEIGAVPASSFGNKGKAKIAWILAGFLFLGTCPLFSAETVKKENAWEQIASIEKRGVLNFATTPAEFGYTFQSEKKAHPKAWPLTYVPRAFTNMAIRVGSSVNDLIVLPLYVKWSESTPLTRRFDLPDYVWEKE